MQTAETTSPHVQETCPPVFDFQSLDLGDCENVGSQSSRATDQPASELQAMQPIRFDKDQMDVVSIRQELDALPGHHRSVHNRMSSVRRLLQLRFDCDSTALRPFDDLHHDRADALRPK